MKNIIGIDIGGTKITGIVFNGQAVLKELTIVTPKTLIEFKCNLIKLVDFLSADCKISAVGIGMAGVIDVKWKVAIYSPNIKYIKNFNFNLIHEWAGYISSLDKTKVAENIMVKGSQNIYKNISGNLFYFLQ